MLLFSDFLKSFDALPTTSDKEVFLLAVSGGVDSMVLANLFLQQGIAFEIAHCNYQLRGEASHLDEELVRDWAQQHAIPFHVQRFDTKTISAELKKGTQETARILRYDWFRSLMQKHQFIAIVTAHHANDNAETVLMNLFKGTGIDGLTGMQLFAHSIFRPLLSIFKTEIETYALEHQIPYRQDASNLSDDYTRNAIRLNVIPTIEKLFPSAMQAINTSIHHLNDAASIYHDQMDHFKKKLLFATSTETKIPIRLLIAQPAYSTILFELLKPYGFNSKQQKSILELLQAQNGKMVLSSTHRIFKFNHHLVITPIEQDQTRFYVIQEGDEKVHLDKGLLEISILQGPMNAIPNELHTAYIAMESLEFPLLLRHWKEGDYFYPLGMNNKKKKLSDFFIDQKVPMHLKETTWVLESNQRIVWIVGMRLDERFKIKNSTTAISKITFKAL
jgi:tRNA(Ile)-lysidine synthase